MDASGWTKKKRRAESCWATAMEAQLAICEQVSLIVSDVFQTKLIGWLMKIERKLLDRTEVDPPRARPAVLPMPDFADLHRQRQRNAHLTQQLLWAEYRQANPDGYRYSRFCELYQRWRRKQDVVLRQEHKAGEKLFVDWAGTTIPIYDPTGAPYVYTGPEHISDLARQIFSRIDQKAQKSYPPSAALIVNCQTDRAKRSASGSDNVWKKCLDG